MLTLTPEQVKSLILAISRLHSNVWDHGFACGNPDAGADDETIEKILQHRLDS